MRNILEIPPYIEGYNDRILNSIDLPVAAASGYYNYDNYYYYSFYYVLFTNWTTVDSSKWDLRNRILNRLGLSLNPYPVTNPEELLATLKTNIDNHKPPLLLATYHSLFYHPCYLQGKGSSNATHFCVIAGYDSERKIIVLREYAHLDMDVIATVVRPFVRADIFHKFYITENMLRDIWKMSNDVYLEENSFHANSLYLIEKSGNSVIDEYNYIDLLKDFLGNLDLSHSKLSELFIDQDRICNLIKGASYKADVVMQIYSNALIVLFDAIEKTFKFIGHDAAIKQEFYNFKDKYLDFRKSTVARLLANAFRGKRFTESEIDEVIDGISKMDKELFSLISNIYIELSTKKNY